MCLIAQIQAHDQFVEKSIWNDAPSLCAYMDCGWFTSNPWLGMANLKYFCYDWYLLPFKSNYCRDWDCKTAKSELIPIFDATKGLWMCVSSTCKPLYVVWPRHAYQILNLPLILSNFEGGLYLARWCVVVQGWGAKLLYRHPTKSTSNSSILKQLISPTSEMWGHHVWQVIQILIKVAGLASTVPWQCSISLGICGYSRRKRSFVSSIFNHYECLATVQLAHFCLKP